MRLYYKGFWVYHDNTGACESSALNLRSLLWPWLKLYFCTLYEYYFNQTGTYLWMERVYNTFILSVLQTFVGYSLSLRSFWFVFMCLILKSCINISAGFISPENASECIKLINEIRVLPNDHKAKQLKLEVIISKNAD